MHKFIRICPSCGKEIHYTTNKVFWKAQKHTSTCRPCFYKRLIGRKHSIATKNKIGASNSISLRGNIPYNKGLPMNEDQKIKCRVAHLGKKASDETKRKHRIDRLRRLKEYKIPPTEDRGAADFFRRLNKNGFDFKPKTFWNLGYIADGYDENLHVWMEFDPPHHYYVDGKLKDKDVVRQKNIVEYFKSKGNPLSDFIRVRTDKEGTLVKEIVSMTKGAN